VQLNLLQDDPVLSQETVSHPSQPASVEESLMQPSHDDPALAEDKAPSAFKTISEVAGFLSVPQHVLRFWESRFSQIKPLKLRGGRRYYRPEDIEVLTTIKNLLYKQGYTIKGAKKAFGKDLEGAVSAAPATPVKTKSTISDKQKSQLTVIRHELSGLKSVLAPYIKRS